jgi:hypothetical protein
VSFWQTSEVNGTCSFPYEQVPVSHCWKVTRI